MVKASKSGKPKRALAAYMFFQMDRTPKLRAANPGMAQTEIFKLVGEEWRNATDKIKEVRGLLLFWYLLCVFLGADSVAVRTGFVVLWLWWSLLSVGHMPMAAVPCWGCC